MVAVKAPSSLRLLLSVPLCLLGWCASHPTAPRPVAVRATSPAPDRPTQEQTAIAHVRSLPLYQQAETACKAHCYPDAAHSLSRLLAETRLSPAESLFVRKQRALCLRDAGLPASRVTPASYRPSPPTEISLPAPSLSVEQADCGPRALAFLCARLGIKTDLATLRHATGTSVRGTSMAGLAEGAKGLGLHTEGVQVSREALSEVRLPAIAYINGNHFVAVLSVQGSGEEATATIHDPNTATDQTLSQERLLRLSSGYLLSVWR